MFRTSLRLHMFRPLGSKLAMNLRELFNYFDDFDVYKNIKKELREAKTANK